jgi:uncharacterized protein YjiS (DUF1127 family)
MAYLAHSQTTCARHGHRQRLGLWSYLTLWKQRRALARMEPWQKRDLGLSDHEVAVESKRAPWDAPDNWRR